MKPWTVVLACVLVLLPYGPANAGSFFHADPWYSFSGVDLGTPDKFGHYYGSAATSRVVGPWLALACGVLYECYDGARGVGFSWRDVVADGLGVLSESVHGSPVFAILDWSADALVLRVGLTFK